MEKDIRSIILPHDHDQPRTPALLARMPAQKHFDNTAQVFSLISDPSRVKILWLLCHTEDCVANIAAVVGMSSPAVSHHLRVLRQAGILSYRKAGKEALYTLADTEEAQLIHHIVDIIFGFKCEGRY